MSDRELAILAARHEALLRQHLLLRDMFTRLLPHLLSAVPAAERKNVADALAKMPQELSHENRASWTMERRAGFAAGFEDTAPTDDDPPPTSPTEHDPPKLP